MVMYRNNTGMVVFLDFGKGFQAVSPGDEVEADVSTPMAPLELVFPPPKKKAVKKEKEPVEPPPEKIEIKKASPPPKPQEIKRDEDKKLS